MKVAIVGVTGLVGERLLEVLEERKFPVTELLPVASERSVGKSVQYCGKTYDIIDVEKALYCKPHLAIFSAGAQASLDYAPRFADISCRVIDNSSCWRMDASKPLVVPEINADTIKDSDYIIANPNCSTIQMLLPLYSLHKAFKIKRIVVSTYQSVTGSGNRAVSQMQIERAKGIDSEELAGNKFYPHPIDQNILPHIDSFLDNAYTKEEMKMVNETHKIFSDESIAISATTVRVPVLGGHSESINVEFEREFDLVQVRQLWEEMPGVTIQDEPSKNIYPMPLYSLGKDDVFVGRLRRDFSIKNGINFWCVADNIRKGAATNAVQIAEYLLNKKILLP